MKKKSFKILIIFFLISSIGSLFYSKLAIRLNPTRSLQTINLHYTWASASPEMIETNVTSILESRLSLLSGIKNINSKSSSNQGEIVLKFEDHIDIEIARFYVSDIVKQLYPKLPKSLNYPTILINQNVNDLKAFLSYSINAPDNSYGINKTIQEKILPHLNRISQINKVQTYGANSKEYLIIYKDELLNSLGLNKEDIISSLQFTFNKQNLGSLNVNNNSIIIQSDQNSDIWNNIPISKVNNKIIYLNQIADVIDSEREAQKFYRINGKNAISILLFAEQNANTIRLAEEVDKVIKHLTNNLPSNYQVIKVYDSTEYLKTEIYKIYKRLILTIVILLGFVIVFYKNIKYLMIIILSLFANITIAFFFYFIFNIQLELYSLAGATISLGLIIDNTIVMINHIRNKHLGNMFIPILASTLTTIGTLSIIFFLEENDKMLLTDFALVIIINLSVSMIISFILIPALMDKIYINKKEQKINTYNFLNNYQLVIKVLLKYKKTLIIFIILVFGLPFFMLPDKLEENNLWYQKTYNSTFGNEIFIKNIKPYLARYFGGSLRLFTEYVFETAYYGKKEELKLFIDASIKKGATIQQLNEAMLEIEGFLNQYSEIKRYTTTINNEELAQIEISFNDEVEKSSFPYFLKKQLIAKAIDLGGLNWDIHGVGVGFNNKGRGNEPISFKLKSTGYEYQSLIYWTDSLKRLLMEHPRTVNVLIKENDKTEKKHLFQYQYLLDKELLSLSGNTPSSIFSSIKEQSIKNDNDLFLLINGKVTPVSIKSNNSRYSDLWMTKQQPLQYSNKFINLGSVSYIAKVTKLENIYRKNQEYELYIEHQYYGNEKDGLNFLGNQLETLKKKLPLGYKFKKEKDKVLLKKESNYSYIILLFSTIIIIYIICSILFESFIQPFIILSVIPISFVGVFLTFYLFNFNFDQGGLACFLLLIGLSVNASIFIVNGFNELKKKFPNDEKVLLFNEAFKQKITPIILSSVSTILGFIPFIIDGENEIFWFSLAVGSIGGIIFSFIGIIFYLPIFSLKRV